jgi:cytochrome c
MPDTVEGNALRGVMQKCFSASGICGGGAATGRTPPIFGGSRNTKKRRPPMTRAELEAALAWADWLARSKDPGPALAMAKVTDRLKEQYARIIVKTKRFEEGNCPICGYNGPGYFQPDKHPCAKYYHRDYPLDEALNSGDGSYKP